LAQGKEFEEGGTKRLRVFLAGVPREKVEEAMILIHVLLGWFK
jgi:hypothetical protein